MVPKIKSFVSRVVKSLGIAAGDPQQACVLKWRHRFPRDFGGELDRDEVHLPDEMVMQLRKAKAKSQVGDISLQAGTEGEAQAMLEEVAAHRVCMGRTTLPGLTRIWKGIKGELTEVSDALRKMGTTGVDPVTDELGDVLGCVALHDELDAQESKAIREEPEYDGGTLVAQISDEATRAGARGKALEKAIATGRSGRKCSALRCWQRATLDALEDKLYKQMHAAMYEATDGSKSRLPKKAAQREVQHWSLQHGVAEANKAVQVVVAMVEEKSQDLAKLTAGWREACTVMGRVTNDQSRAHKARGARVGSASLRLALGEQQAAAVGGLAKMRDVSSQLYKVASVQGHQGRVPQAGGELCKALEMLVAEAGSDAEAAREGVEEALAAVAWAKAKLKAGWCASWKRSTAEEAESQANRWRRVSRSAREARSMEARVETLHSAEFRAVLRLVRKLMVLRKAKGDAWLQMGLDLARREFGANPSLRRRLELVMVAMGVQGISPQQRELGDPEQQ
jgi:hypothetical protein